MGSRGFRRLVCVLLGAVAVGAAAGHAQEGGASRASLRELRKGLDLLEEAEEAMLLSGEGLALAFERFHVAQARVDELLAGSPPGVREVLAAIGDAGICDCADFRAARQAYRVSQENYQKAAEVFNRIASASPDLADAHLMDGVARLGLSDTQGALEAFKRAKALGAQKVNGLHLRDPDAIFEAPLEAWRLGEVAHAVSVGARIAPLDTRVPPLYGYGLAYGEAGVRFAFREGALRVPKAPPAQEEEDLFAALDGGKASDGDLFSAASSAPTAKASPAQDAPASAPVTAQPVETSPVASQPPPEQEQQKPAAAEPAIAGIDEQVGQLASLASTHAKQGACEEAQRVLDGLGQAIAGAQLDEFSKAALAGAYFNLGSAHLKQVRFAEALAAYDKSRQFDPGQAKTYYCIGMIHRASEEYAQAADALEQAVKLNPGLVPAHFGLGNVYLRLERQQEAEQAFRTALALEPKHAAAQYMLGLVAYTKGDWGEAVAAWKKVLEIEPDHKNAKEWLPKAEMRLAG